MRSCRAASRSPHVVVADPQPGQRTSRNALDRSATATPRRGVGIRHRDPGDGAAPQLRTGVDAGCRGSLALGGSSPARADPETARWRRAGLLRRPGTSNRTAEAITAASNTSEAPPSASTSPTTSPDHCWGPAASDPDYTLPCEEPASCARINARTATAAPVPVSGLRVPHLPDVGLPRPKR